MRDRERHEMILRQQQQASQRALAPMAGKPATELPDESPEPSLLKPLLRYWWMIALFGGMGLGAAFLYLKHAPRLYTSFAKIYIQPTPGAVLEFIGNAERGNFLSTQAEVITSRPILDKVVEQNPSLKQMKTFDGAGGDVVSYLIETLDVQLERKTDLIEITMYSPYPEEAAKIVTAVTDAYILHMESDRDQKSKELLSSLEQARKVEEGAIDVLRKQVAEFIHDHPTASVKPGVGSIDQTNLDMIAAKKTEKELALLTAKATFGASHRNVRAPQEELDGINKLYEAAMARLTVQRDDTAALTEIQLQIDQKADLIKKLSERIHDQELKTSGRKLVAIELVEPARVAKTPSYPRKHRTLAVAVVSGMLIGAGLALLRDRFDGRMRTVEEIQNIVGLPILGVVPAMTGRRTAIARAMAVHLDPRSPVAEAYRTVRTAVYFGTNGSACKTLLITSPEPGDGKTTSASNLAIAIAQTGRSVLLLDADFRKPTQHKNLDIKDAIGLSSVLANREPLENAIQQTGVEGLDILPCGPIPANPSEILNSREFGELVDTLARRYDHILFDSPPVNRVTDARILGAVCDATILVLRANQSTRKAGEHARNALMGVGARVLGAIVNSAPNSRGYEVYGGSYYGPSDGAAQPRRIRTTPQGPVAEDESPRRRNIA